MRGSVLLGVCWLDSNSSTKRDTTKIIIFIIIRLKGNFNIPNV